MSDEASPGPLVSIGDAARQTGVPQHVLRYWEGRLPQLRPVKRAGGRRYYRPRDLALIREVQRLVEREGFTLEGAARALGRRGGVAVQEQASPSPAPAANVPSRALADGELLARLTAIRNRLARALDA